MSRSAQKVMTPTCTCIGWGWRGWGQVQNEFLVGNSMKSADMNRKKSCFSSPNSLGGVKWGLRESTDKDILL